MRTIWYSLAWFTLFSGFIFYSFSSATPAQDLDSKTTDHDGLPQEIRSVVIDKKFNFAGEDLPTDQADVKERLERELLVNSYRHSSTIQYLKLMPRYFPLIESILAEEGLPDDFKYLAVAESGLRAVVSPAGAKGLWQFMKGTGKQFGLEINYEVDERYHVEKSTRAACTYLKELKSQFGSWTLAAAGYNMGPTALSKDLRYQKESKYYNLNLSRETMRYIFRIVALKEIHQYMSKYGYYMEASDYYQPLDNVTTLTTDQSIISLADFAHKYGITYRELKQYNPWLLDYKLTNKSGKNYSILIPKR